MWGACKKVIKKFGHLSLKQYILFSRRSKRFLVIRISNRNKGGKQTCGRLLVASTCQYWRAFFLLAVFLAMLLLLVLEGADL